MSATTLIQQLNRDLGDQVLAEAKQNPQAYPGKYVGIANGQVVVVTDDLDELGRQLEQVEPNAGNTIVVEPGRDLREIHTIWEVR